MNEWIDIIGMPVYSKKNSKVMAGKRLLSSKPVREYEKRMANVYEEKRSEWLRQWDNSEKPVHLEFHFIFPSSSRRDLMNICQLPLDMMQEYGWIEDDNMDYINEISATYEVLHKAKDKCGFRVRIKK